MKEVKAAKEICDQCPVLADCLKFAIVNREEYGIWGGTSGRSRTRIWAMLSQGTATLEQVIRDYKSGNTAKYETSRCDEY